MNVLVFFVFLLLAFALINFRFRSLGIPGAMLLLLLATQVLSTGLYYEDGVAKSTVCADTYAYNGANIANITHICSEIANAEVQVPISFTIPASIILFMVGLVLSWEAAIPLIRSKE